MKEKYMQEAIKEALKALNIDEIPIGAVIVLNNEIIGRGYNQKEKTNNPIMHAEIAAIIDASKNISSWRLNDCEIYITQEPCAMCAGAIIQSRIKKVVYGVKSPKSGHHTSIYNILENEQNNHCCEVESNVCKKEIEKMMKDFFKKIRTRGESNGSK